MAVSPFRSTDATVRSTAAKKIVQQRKHELESLERKWAGERRAKFQRLLMTRIMATRNNIVSWQDYIAQGCPRIANATTLV